MENEKEIQAHLKELHSWLYNEFYDEHRTTTPPPLPPGELDDVYVNVFITNSRSFLLLEFLEADSKSCAVTMIDKLNHCFLFGLIDQYFEMRNTFRNIEKLVADSPIRFEQIIRNELDNGGFTYRVHVITNYNIE